MEQPSQRNDLQGDLALVAILVIGAVSATTYAGAWLAAQLTAPRSFTPGLDDAFTAALHLNEHRGDPRQAWPEQYRAALPGPVAYWLMNALVVVLLLAIAFLVITRHWRKDTLDHRERLGVDTQARAATRNDLAHLYCESPTRGDSSSAATDADGCRSKSSACPAGADDAAAAGAPSPTSGRPNRARPPTSSKALSTSADP